MPRSNGITLLIFVQDIPPFHVAAGNPAKIIRKIETAMDPAQKLQANESPKDVEGAEGPMARSAA